MNQFRPDVVIIKLKTPFTINKHVAPACLPKNPIEPGSECYVSGWGHTKPVGHLEKGQNNLNFGKPGIRHNYENRSLIDQILSTFLDSLANNEICHR